MKKFGLGILFIVLFELTVSSQYIPLMNGYFKSNQFYNPAGAGMKNHMVAYTGLRKQWVRVKGAPSTQMMAFDSPLSKQRFGIGGVYYHDKIGATSTNGLQLNYSYRIRISRKTKLAFGVNAGMENRKFNRSELELINDVDNAFSGQFQNVNKFKLGAGTILYNKKITFGISVNDLIKEKRFANLITYFQYTKKINRDWEFAPSILLKANTLQIKQVELATYTSYKEQFLVNLGYRTNGSIIAGLGFKPKSQFLVMYSYDYVAGKLSKYTSGSHELILRYDFVHRYRTSSRLF